MVTTPLNYNKHLKYDVPNSVKCIEQKNRVRPKSLKKRVTLIKQIYSYVNSTLTLYAQVLHVDIYQEYSTRKGGCT